MGRPHPRKTEYSSRSETCFLKISKALISESVVGREWEKNGTVFVVTMFHAYGQGLDGSSVRIDGFSRERPPGRKMNSFAF
jgi:hypothetical protein